MSLFATHLLEQHRASMNLRKYAAVFPRNWEPRQEASCMHDLLAWCEDMGLRARLEVMEKLIVPHSAHAGSCPELDLELRDELRIEVQTCRALMERAVYLEKNPPWLGSLKWWSNPAATLQGDMVRSIVRMQMKLQLLETVRKL